METALNQRNSTVRRKRGGEEGEVGKGEASDVKSMHLKST